MSQNSCLLFEKVASDECCSDIFKHKLQLVVSLLIRNNFFSLNDLTSTNLLPYFDNFFFLIICFLIQATCGSQKERATSGVKLYVSFLTEFVKLIGLYFVKVVLDFFFYFFGPGGHWGVRLLRILDMFWFGFWMIGKLCFWLVSEWYIRYVLIGFCMIYKICFDWCLNYRLYMFWFTSLVKLLNFFVENYSFVCRSANTHRFYWFFYFLFF